MGFALKTLGKYVFGAFILLTLLFTSIAPGNATVGDPRFAMSGGCSPLWGKYDEIGSTWFLNWGMSLSTSYVNSNYPYVRMYWRTTANEYTDAQIQSWASTARLLYGPGVPIWWTASNEPNDRGQANQTPTAFAAGYYQYYRNLKIGDPDCKVLGPGMLNWTFLSDSVWQKGKDWYEAFRQVWASNPTYSAYSMAIQGNPYPPMDAFNMHTYDLRGIQGTPWAGPADWKYLRDETLACYSSLQTYPETMNLKIWNTEYGALRVGTLTDSADTLGGIGLWFRQQAFMERWFFFIAYTGDSSWQQTVLFDNSGHITSLGKTHYTLSTMGNAEVYNLPFNAAYNSGTTYTRPGGTYTTNLTESYDYGLTLYPNQGAQLTAGQMRGRTYSTPRRVRRVTFNYYMSCDPSCYQIEMDIPGHTGVWTSASSTSNQWADIDLSAYNVTDVSLGLYCKVNNVYSGTTGVSKAQISNITLWYDNTVNTSPAQAKSLPDHRHVNLNNVVVSGVLPNGFAVQCEDRSSGIIVKGTADIIAGDRCTVEGDTALVDGVRTLINPVVSNKDSGSAPKPVLMNTLALGGGAAGLQDGVVDSAESGKMAAGLSNIGLLVKVAGKVTAVDFIKSFFYLDDGSNLSDGSGYKGIRISLSGTSVPQVGANATVTGICSATMINGRLARFIRPRSADDACFDKIVDLTNLLSNSSFELGSYANWNSSASPGVVITGTDSYGISAYDGNCFFESAITGTLKSGAICQVMTVTPGSFYAFVASRVLHNGNTSTAVKNRIGIDPLGGLNINAASVSWSDWDMQADSNVSEWRFIGTPTVNVTGTKVTVFLRYYQEQPAGLHVNCFDNAYVLKAD